MNEATHAQPVAASRHMRAWLYLLPLLMISVLMVGRGDAAQKGLTRAQSQQVYSENENYAVIVGVDQYDNLSTLNYAVEDARKLSEFFRQQGYEVELLTDYKASRSRILKAVQLVADLATDDGSQERGNIVFAFSGHGFRDSRHNYLATSDTDPDNLAGSALAMNELTELLAQSRVRQRVLFIDACRNDPAKGAANPLQTFHTDNSAEGLAVMYSTRAGSLSWEDQQLGQGVFSHYLIEGLQGEAASDDGLVTFDKLHRYVNQKVKRHVRARFSKKQIPYIGGERTGEFVVALAPGRSMPAPRPTPEPTPVPQPPGKGRFAVTVAPGSARVCFYHQSQWHCDRNYELPLGESYPVFASASGYQNYEARATLRQNGQPLDIQLEADTPGRQPYEPEMVLVNGGCYQMGSPKSEEGRDTDENQRRVCVKDVYAGVYEVTFAQYDAFAKATGRDLPTDRGWGRGNRPVINVSWKDATAFAQWLSEQTGKAYRLPTEAEWEYAARAGSTGAYWWGDAIGSNRANCDGCGSRWDDDKTAPTGSFTANAFGLYDTVGNVWEWTCSVYEADYSGSESRCDSSKSARRALRGGGWFNNPPGVRSANRFRDFPDNRYFLGFRVFQDVR